VARDEDGGSLQLCCMLCTRKVEDLCNWIYVVIFDAIAMVTTFCTVVLSTDPENSTVTQEFCLKQKVGRYTLFLAHGDVVVGFAIFHIVLFQK
jgi:hypothetical protein